MWDDVSPRFREALRYSHTPIMRVRSLSDIQFVKDPIGGRELETIKGDVKYVSTADIKSTLSLTVPGTYWDDVNPRSTELFAERGIDYGDGTQEYVPLGYFRPTNRIQDSAPYGTINVPAPDRTFRLKQLRAVYKYAFEDGISHRMLFERLINGYAIGPNLGDTVFFPMYYGKTVPIVFLGYDGDRTTLPAGVVEDYVYDFIAKAVGEKSCMIRMSRIGEILIDLKNRPRSEASVYTIEPGAGGNLIKVSRDDSDDGEASILAVTGSDPAHPVGTYWLANDNNAHPLYFRGPFQAVIKKYASPFLQSDAQLASAAEKLFSQYVQESPSGISAIALPDPTLEIMDVIDIPTTISPGTEVVDEITVSLDRPTPLAVKTRPQSDTTGELDPADYPGSGSGVLTATFRDQRAHPKVTPAGANNIVNVANSAQLTSALAAAKAGDCITLADGTYSGNFILAKKGTSGQPIVVKAANQLGAVFADGTRFTLSSAEWCYVAGLNAPYDITADTFSMIGDCKFCRITRCLVGPGTGPIQPLSYKFGFGSCINATNSNALSRAATMGLDGFYMAGDMFYKDGASPNWVADWTAQMAAPGYSALLNSLKRKDWHWVNVSDHEGYANDAPRESFGSAFQSAYRQKFADIASQLPPAGGINRYWTVGRVLHVMQDQRSFRSHDSAADNSSKTMLGFAQRAWFFALIDAAAGVFPLMIVHGDIQIHAPAQAGDDSWAGFTNERAVIKAKLDSKPNLKAIYLHGNMHACMSASNTSLHGYDYAWGAGPLNQDTKVSAGGANLDWSVPTNKNEGPRAEQFGVIEIVDSGTAIGAFFKAYNASGAKLGQSELVFNAPSAATTTSNTPAGNYFAIRDRSQDCVIDYCELRNKTRPGHGILQDGDSSVAGNAGGCKHILIAHNYLRNFGSELPSGFDAIQIGSDQLSLTESNSAVIRNRFEAIVAGPEVLSLRMGKLDAWGNTLVGCTGGIVARSGKGAYVGHNYIFGPPASGSTKTGGVRAYDSDHDISENYAIYTGDKQQSAVILDGGESVAPGLSGHWPAKNTSARKNLLIAGANGIALGSDLYPTPPDSVQVTDNLVVAALTNAAIQTVKAPTGASKTSPNTFNVDAASAGLVIDSAKVIFQHAGVGPRLTYLYAADVGVAGDVAEEDGTGKSLAGVPGDAPSGDGGTPTDPGTTPPPTATTFSSAAQCLKLGKGPGLNKVNLGVGLTSGHVDLSLDQLQNGQEVPGYYGLLPDKSGVALITPLNGKTTSSNTKYPRVEFRGLAANGSAKQAFNPNANGSAIVYASGAVFKMPPKKPQLVLAQLHDASDDVAMIYMSSKTTVQAKLGDTVVGTLTNSFAFGTRYGYGIRVVGDGSKCYLEYYFGTSLAAASVVRFRTGAAKRSTQWYGKAGNYAQSNASTDNVSDGPFIVVLYDLMIWDSSQPAPAALRAF